MTPPRKEIVDQKAFLLHQRKPHPLAIKRTHVWKTFRKIPWPVCGECGMVRLHNATTAACERFGCWHYPD